MAGDTRFITNEEGQTLVDRFKVLIGDDTVAFDCLVGYFYASGFFLLQDALSKTDKVRILIGLATDRRTTEFINAGRAQGEFRFSHAETKDAYIQEVVDELGGIDEMAEIERGVRTFMEWIATGKLEIRVFPSRNIHAKLYILTHEKGSKDIGRVVTGSSNFSVSGLTGNLEFNVELKDSPDYKFAIEKFEELWDQAVEVGDVFLDTMDTRTWVSRSITPYELFLKCLYEYFLEDINERDDSDDGFVPDNFKKLAYQNQAVLSARKVLKKFGGVFLSDVVGLGKTYISAMLARRLLSDGRILVLAPPALLDPENPGSWRNVFFDFQVPARFESVGQLEKILRDGPDKYATVFIDEAHRFRSEDNETYANLARICFGKQVVLVTATPYNNRPSDILAQIKLFQRAHDSTIPNVRDLQAYFSRLENRAKEYNRKTDYENYIRVVRENARLIREDILRHLMVRRTRTEVQAYFPQDISDHGLSFPEVSKPEPLFYRLNATEEKAFQETVTRLARLTFARYTPLLYLTKALRPQEQLAQANLKGFMKTLFFKRMESSIVAFRSTLSKSIKSYRSFIDAFDDGAVYVSPKHLNKIFEAFDLDDDDAIEELLEAGKAEKYLSENFDPKVREDAEADLNILEEIEASWEGITRDPKILELLESLGSRKELADAKPIIFTEAAVTAAYLREQIEKHTNHRVLLFTGTHSAADRRRVIENFDANAPRPKNDFDILVSTEVLSEGVNLHRSNVIINYDIPWNPTRMMQRVGRVNRIGTTFDRIHTFNFFPTKEVNDEIALREAAEAKIESFIEMLGADAKLLTENEQVEPKGLFEILNSKEALEDEEDAADSELRYLEIIRTVRDENTELFARIRELPKKARSARVEEEQDSDAVLTFFRKGALVKFMMTDAKGLHELDFLAAAKMLEVVEDTALYPMSEEDMETFYERFDANKDGFELAASEAKDELGGRGRGRSVNLKKIASFVKAIRKDERLTDIDTEFLDDLKDALDAGVIPRNAAKNLVRDLEAGKNDPLDLLAILRNSVDPAFLERRDGGRRGVAESREIVLSEFLKAT